MNIENFTQEAALARPEHDAIARRAQEIWENVGRPVGRDEEIWLQAERELTEQFRGASVQSGTSGSGTGSAPQSMATVTTGNFKSAPARAATSSRPRTRKTGSK